MQLKKSAGVALALSAAGLFACAPATIAVAEDAPVHCSGVNKCKGYNDCKTANNACKGHAACKGQGFVKMSKHACEEIGGTADS
ncbi:MAG: hypothetical protein LJE70_13610 [Chromatiaceae bacterium]|jgi:hypothetical protein|nr:hypothetical protein [Chromatiaceae bacterium]